MSYAGIPLNAHELPAIRAGWLGAGMVLAWCWRVADVVAVHQARCLWWLGGWGANDGAKSLAAEAELDIELLNQTGESLQRQALEVANGAFGQFHLLSH